MSPHPHQTDSFPSSKNARIDNQKPIGVVKTNNKTFECSKVQTIIKP